jgi:vancomycin permeability regulator SanA
MFCFGKTDYRRSAEAVVVFGARAYADGTCSDALADRVRTGCRLYLDGVVRKVIFSGGPGDGAVHECEAMRRLAIGMGVPDKDIILDHEGLNTRATVRNTCGLPAAQPTGRLLAVSHFYHLPRIKLQYRRAGREVFTIPAEEEYTLTKMPYLMFREIAAFWFYFLFPGSCDG